MLINRTYRTYIYDYPQYYAGSSESSHRTPSTSCPNDISSMVADISSVGNTFVADSFISVNLNATTGNHTNYIFLYSGSTSGLINDIAHPFYGEISDVGTDVVSNGFINIPINGQSYYIRRYIGPSNSTCSTTLRCTVVPDSLGNFIQAGYVIINAVGTFKFMRVYTLQ